LLKNQRNSLILEWISRQIGRWGGSSRVNEGMGVNHPSIKPLDLTMDGEIHTTHKLADQFGKGGNVVRKREKSTRDGGSRKRTGENPGNVGTSKY
jgi:hypothetical protein